MKDFSSLVDSIRPLFEYINFSHPTHPRNIKPKKKEWKKWKEWNDANCRFCRDWIKNPISLLGDSLCLAAATSTTSRSQAALLHVLS
jgi:hypothetical protein